MPAMTGRAMGHINNSAQRRPAFHGSPTGRLQQSRGQMCGWGGCGANLETGSSGGPVDSGLSTQQSARTDCIGLLVRGILRRDKTYHDCGINLLVWRGRLPYVIAGMPAARPDKILVRGLTLSRSWSEDESTLPLMKACLAQRVSAASSNPTDFISFSSESLL